MIPTTPIWWSYTHEIECADESVVLTRRKVSPRYMCDARLRMLPARAVMIHSEDRGILIDRLNLLPVMQICEAYYGEGSAGQVTAELNE